MGTVSIYFSLKKCIRKNNSKVNSYSNHPSKGLVEMELLKFELTQKMNTVVAEI